MMTTTAHRATHADPLWISPAVENFAHIAKRVESLFSFNRRMTMIERYVNEKGADNLKIYRDLELDTDFDNDPAISVAWPTEASAGGLTVRLTGSHRVGFITAELSEREAARRFEASDYRATGVTQLRMEGGLGRPTNDDFFEREHINSYGVSEIKTVIFHS